MDLPRDCGHTVLLAATCAAALLSTAGCARSSLKGGEEQSTAVPDASAQPTTTTTTTSPPPTTVLFRLSFISDVDESIYVDETSPSWLSTGFWLGIVWPDGVSARKAPACELCMCDSCPNCPICGAPCDTVTAISTGGSTEWLWDGMRYPTAECPSAPEPCQQPEAAPAGSYTAEFCWGLTYEGTLPCPAEVVDVHCADVSFNYPDSDGLVEYVVNNGG